MCQTQEGLKLRMTCNAAMLFVRASPSVVSSFSLTKSPTAKAICNFIPSSELRTLSNKRGARKASQCRGLTLECTRRGAHEGCLPRRRCFAISSSRKQSLVPTRAAADPSVATEEKKSEAAPSFSELKAFFEDLKRVGRVRLIVNTGLGVLESVTTLDGLFYAEFGKKGEYANVMKSEDNVDFHLLLSKVASVKIETNSSPITGRTTYMVRLLDTDKNAGASILVMWKPGTQGEYDEGQVEAFLHLKEKYGEEYNLHYIGSEEASEL